MSEQSGQWDVRAQTSETDPAEVKFARDVRRARQHLQMSQQAVAAQMREQGYAYFRQQTLGKVEAGERGIRLGEAIALARITGVSLQGPTDAAPEAREVRDAAGALEATSTKLAEAARRLRELAEAL